MKRTREEEVKLSMETLIVLTYLLLHFLQDCASFQDRPNLFLLDTIPTCLPQISPWFSSFHFHHGTTFNPVSELSLCSTCPNHLRLGKSRKLFLKNVVIIIIIIIIIFFLNIKNKNNNKIVIIISCLWCCNHDKDTEKTLK